MDHRLLQQATFWTALLSLDQELAAKARQAGCSCGGVLHRADFLRKPRGGPPDLPPEYCYRFSFCCNREGCRKRVTPPSLWFLDRKVYLHAVIILVAALRQGPTPRRVRERSRPSWSRPCGKGRPRGESANVAVHFVRGGAACGKSVISQWLASGCSRGCEYLVSFRGIRRAPMWRKGPIETSRSERNPGLR